MGKKIKFYKRPIDPEKSHSKEFREMESKSIEELALQIMKTEETFYENPKIGEVAYRSFYAGFYKAKEMIIKFLMQKQMGYGEAFFFRLSDIEEIGESK